MLNRWMFCRLMLKGYFVAVDGEDEGLADAADLAGVEQHGCADGGGEGQGGGGFCRRRVSPGTFFFAAHSYSSYICS